MYFMIKNMKTKYRTINNGYWDYLQYEIKYKFLFFWTLKKWEYVWKPYCDITFGRRLTSENYLYINSLNDDIDKFVKRWTNIEEYFINADLRQKELEKIYEEHQNEIEKKKKKVVYL